MLSFALGALIMALVAGILGFGGVASASTAVALIVFYVFLGLFVVSLLGMALGASREAREHTA